MQNFMQPVFKAREERFKRSDTLEQDLEGILKEAMEGLAERLVMALGHELRRMVEEMLKETVPKLLQEIERDEKNKENKHKDGRLLSWQRHGEREP